MLEDLLDRRQGVLEGLALPQFSESLLVLMILVLLMICLAVFLFIDEPIVGKRLKPALSKIGCDVEVLEHVTTIPAEFTPPQTVRTGTGFSP